MFYVVVPGPPVSATGVGDNLGGPSPTPRNLVSWASRGPLVEAAPEVCGLGETDQRAQAGRACPRTEILKRQQVELYVSTPMPTSNRNFNPSPTPPLPNVYV